MHCKGILEKRVGETFTPFALTIGRKVMNYFLNVLKRSISHINYSQTGLPFSLQNQAALDQHSDIDERKHVKYF